MIGNRLGLIGLSCSTCNGLGAVSDYDVIKVGGKIYTSNQIVDKTVFASVKTPIYQAMDPSNPYFIDWTKPSWYVNAGAQIGKVFSYLKPTSSRGGRAALMFYDGANKAYYVLDENVIDTGTIKDQGGKTVAEEIAEEKDKEEKENDPISYYLKKFGIPVLLIGGAIYLVGTLGKEVVKAKLT